MKVRVDAKAIIKPKEDINFLMDVIYELSDWIKNWPNTYDIDFQKLSTMRDKYEYHFHHATYEKGRRERHKLYDECQACVGQNHPGSDYCSGCDKLYYR